MSNLTIAILDQLTDIEGRVARDWKFTTIYFPESAVEARKQISATTEPFVSVYSHVGSQDTVFPLIRKLVGSINLIKKVRVNQLPFMLWMAVGIMNILLLFNDMKLSPYVFCYLLSLWVFFVRDTTDDDISK